MKAEKALEVWPAEKTAAAAGSSSIPPDTRSEKEWLQLLLEHVGAGLVLLDPELRVVWANKESKCRFGVQDESNGRLCYEAWFGRSEPCEECAALRAFATGQPATAITERRTAAGGIRHYQKIATPILDPRGRVSRVLVLAEDITEIRRIQREPQKKTEMLEVQNRKAIEASKQASRFLASISHDLRAPLASIMGFTEMLLEEPLTEHQRAILLKVSRNAERMLGMINDLLDLHRIECGKMPISLSEVSIPMVARQVVETMAPLVKGKDVVLSADAAPGLPTVRTDEQKLTQILVNLVSNAIKFTPKGSVTISAAVLGGRVDVAVEDTGVGIRRRDFRRIFEEFTQAPRPGTPKGGSGLGLSIARKLARLLGGEIHVVSKLGQGSTFTVRLPISPTRGLLARRAAGS